MEKIYIYNTYCNHIENVVIIDLLAFPGIRIGEFVNLILRILILKTNHTSYFAKIKKIDFCEMKIYNIIEVKTLLLLNYYVEVMKYMLEHCIIKKLIS